jgi:hypothetical protein
MKNLLSENMMRFGTKNLSEAAKKELVLKSIMETIDQHGLQKEVRAALTEQTAGVPDPKWIRASTLSYASTQSGGMMQAKFKPGIKYTQKYTFAAGDNRQGGIVIMPKGTTWQTSPSGLYLLAKGFKVNDMTSFGYAKNPQSTPMMDGLQDGMYLYNATLGKAKNQDGKPVGVTPVNIAYYSAGGQLGIVFVEGMDEPLTQNWPTKGLATMLNQFQQA